MITDSRGVNSRYSCVCLHSDRRPQERNDNLNKFKQGQCNFLICTDVAARGIDIKGMAISFNIISANKTFIY